MRSLIAIIVFVFGFCSEVYKNENGYSLQIKNSVAGSCRDSTADACGSADNQRYNENKQSGGTGSVRNGPGVSNSPQNSGRGGYSGVPNTDKSDEERVCVGGRTPDQIQQAHQYAVDVVEAFVLEGNVAIGMDAVLLNELFKRVKLPRKLDKIKEQVKDIVIGIYASAGAYTLGQVANLTKSRLRGELRQALRTCR